MTKHTTHPNSILDNHNAYLSVLKQSKYVEPLDPKDYEEPLDLTDYIIFCCKKTPHTKV